MKQLSRREEDASFFDGLLRRLRELTGLAEQDGDLREALEELIDEAREEGGQRFTAEQRALLLNALSFGELRVGDVMVPRADLKAVPHDASLKEVIAKMREVKHTRLLVYRETLDDVLGIAHIMDLLEFWGDGEAFSLEQVVRPVLVVPPSMRVIDLLIEMRDVSSHLAIVVDEFGGTDGLVTIEDLVEEIVGELREGKERLSASEFLEHPDGTIDVDARMDLEELEDRLGVELLSEDERDEADTLGGLIFSLVDRVPARGEVVDHPSGFSFEVLDVDPRRIKRVRIHPPRAAENPAVVPDGPTGEA
jgi:CBS domain containing-hemolysin-like protein